MTDERCPPDAADLTVGWVLGTLSRRDASRLRGHLETCSRCRSDVAHAQQVADALAASPQQTSPPGHLRDRLLAVVENEVALSRAADEVATPAPRAPPTRPRRRRVVALASSVAIVLTAAVVAAATLSTDDRAADPPAPVTGSVLEDAGGPRARATVVQRAGSAELVLTRLAGPPSGRVYQAWLVRPPAAAIPTGALFSVPRSGDARIRLPSLRGIERVIVTAEPPRGSRVPTPPPLVIVRLPA